MRQSIFSRRISSLELKSIVWAFNFTLSFYTKRSLLKSNILVQKHPFCYIWRPRRKTLPFFSYFSQSDKFPTCLLFFFFLFPILDIEVNCLTRVVFSSAFKKEVSGICWDHVAKPYHKWGAGVSPWFSTNNDHDDLAWVRNAALEIVSTTSAESPGTSPSPSSPPPGKMGPTPFASVIASPVFPVLYFYIISDSRLAFVPYDRGGGISRLKSSLSLQFDRLSKLLTSL